MRASCRSETGFVSASAEVVVTQPRLPCFKLGLRFGRDDMAKRFLASGRLGFYLKVAVEGEVATGDEGFLIEKAKESPARREITRLYARDKDDLEGFGAWSVSPPLPKTGEIFQGTNSAN